MDQRNVFVSDFCCCCFGCFLMLLLSFACLFVCFGGFPNVAFDIATWYTDINDKWGYMGASSMAVWFNTPGK